MADNSIFVDTGPLFALASKNDQYHEKAFRHLQSLLKQQALLVTSNFIIHETAMMIARRISKKASVKFLDTAHDGESFNIFYIADCASFVLRNDT